MALRTFVKINGITNLTDARYCSGMYVDLLGFDFQNGSDRFVSLTTFKEITGWVSGVDFVAEFESSDSEQIQTVLDDCPEITFLEHKNLGVLLEFQKKGLKPIYKLTFEELAQLSPSTITQLKTGEIFVHVADFKSTLTEVERNSLKDLSQDLQIILGTGINSSNVENQLDELNLFGISMTGGDEIKPGLTDFNELADILEALELED